jgi:hypothetical protein
MIGMARALARHMALGCFAALVAGTAGCAGAAGDDDSVVAEEQLGGAVTVDTTFGVAGVASISYPVPAADADLVANDTLVLADGRLLVLASAFDRPTLTNTSFVTRFTKRGAVDASFGTGGTFAVKGFFHHVSALSGGQILLGGEALVRLTSNGQLDTSFGDNGTRRWTKADVGLAESYIGTPKNLELQSDEVLDGGDGTFFAIVTPKHRGIDSNVWRRVLHVDGNGAVLNPFSNGSISQGNVCGSGYHHFASVNGVVFFTSEYVSSDIDNGTKVERALPASGYHGADPSFVEKLQHIDGVDTSFFGTTLLPFGSEHLVAVRSTSSAPLVVTGLDRDGRVDATLWSAGTFTDRKREWVVFAGAPNIEELFVGNIDWAKEPGQPMRHFTKIRRVGAAGEDTSFKAPAVDGYLVKLAVAPKALYAVTSMFPVPELRITKLRR